jgi:hypothetical protein
MSEFFKKEHKPDLIHEFDVPKSLGGGIMEIRELGMPAYDAVVTESAKGMPDGSDGGAKPTMVEMFAHVGVNKKRLMRIQCVKSVNGQQAWSYEGGPEGFLDSLGIKMLTLVDSAIELIHETSEEEELAFTSSHRLPGAAATNSQSGKESAA